jgi:HEAT repeat protein
VVVTHTFTVGKHGGAVNPFESQEVAEAPPHVKALIEQLYDKNADVRRAAATGLQKQRATPAVPTLVKLVESDWWDGGNISSGGMRIFLAGPGPSKGYMLDALRALAPEKAEEALMVARKSPDDNVRVWATEELGKEKDKK